MNKKTYYTKLKAFANDGQLVIYTLLSNPRTRSTALYYAMESMPDIDGGVSGSFSTHDCAGVHYNFDATKETRKIRTFEEVCEKIYRVVEEILKKKTVARIWLHDHFYEITQHEMHYLLTLSSNYIVCIRDPRLQFLSFLIRVSNDKLATYRQSDLNRDQVIKLFHKKEEDVSPKMLLSYVEKKNIPISKAQILNTIHKKEHQLPFSSALTLSTDIILNYVQTEMKIAVANTKIHLEILKKYQEKSDIRFVIVDSEKLINPVTSKLMLQEVTNKLHGLVFSESLINNWSREGKISMGCTAENTNTPIENAWNGPARKSTKFTMQHDVSGCSILDVDQFPRPLRPVLLDALQLYHSCLAMPNSLEAAVLRKARVLS
jgi:hypothetical protein